MIFKQIYEINIVDFLLMNYESRSLDLANQRVGKGPLTLSFFTLTNHRVGNG